MSRNERGFTLVEIAIVMVIIGLLLGGVLKGQEMVNNARIKRVEDDINSTSAAFLTYQDRYQQLPGDDNGANARFGTVANGNANGVIAGNFDTATAGQESRLVWAHLRAANLVTGSGDVQPKNPFGGLTGVEDSIYGLAGDVVCLSGIPGDAAQTVDTQIDDGNPNSGTVQAGTTHNAVAASYVATSSYDVCSRI